MYIYTGGKKEKKGNKKTTTTKREGITETTVNSC